MKHLERLQQIATHPYLAFAFRLYIGVIFIYASMYKINYAGEFAENIAAYQILPFWAVNITAIVLPWLELVCGILLIVGVRLKASSLIIAGLLLVFSLAILINLLRGTKVGCGCFHGMESQIDWSTLARDIVWLIMTMHVYLYDSILHLEQKLILRLKDV